MPIEVKVVTDAQYAAWLAGAKKDKTTYSPIADNGDDAARFAAR